MATAIFVNLPVKNLGKSKSIEVLVCLSCESREKVDEMVRKAVAAGGTTCSQSHDHGFMYGHGFQDLDGHIWEIMFMERSAINERQKCES